MTTIVCEDKQNIKKLGLATMLKNVPILHSAEWDKTNLSNIIPHDEKTLICDNINVQTGELNKVYQYSEHPQNKLN